MTAAGLSHSQMVIFHVSVIVTSLDRMVADFPLSKTSVLFGMTPRAVFRDCERVREALRVFDTKQELDEQRILHVPTDHESTKSTSRSAMNDGSRWQGGRLPIVMATIFFDVDYSM